MTFRFCKRAVPFYRQKGPKLLQLCILKCFTFLFLMTTVTAPPHKYSLIDGVRYMDVIYRHLSIPRMTCLAVCDGMDDCTSVNHNVDTDMCELTTYVPRLLTPVPSTEPNWMVYYNDRIVLAVDEWQSSTFYHYNGDLSASYATDGNRDNNAQPNHHLYCASTASGNSSWGMEFESAATVSHVLIFFRNATSLNARNTNLRLLISSTRHDSDNNVGTDCATFVGPPASPSPPTKITCTLPVTGKFLKIIHNSTNILTLCEVEVYST